MGFCKTPQASVAEKQLVMARSLLRRRGHLLATCHRERSVAIY